MATKRRGRREGTIGRHQSGLWWGRIDRGIVNGRRNRVAVYGQTREAVSQKLKEKQREIDAGLPISPERLTVEAYLNDWLANSAKPRVRPRTFVGYEAFVRRFLVPGIGQVRLGKLTPVDVERWIQRQTQKGMTAHQANYARSVLRVALSDAVRCELVSRNVAKLVKPPKPVRREISPLTPEQARVFITHMRGARHEALFTVAVALGLRVGEILGLRWEDVDLNANTLSVRQAWQRYGGDPVLRRTLQTERKALVSRLKAKPDRDTRLVLTKRLVELRKQLREQQTKVHFVEPKSRRSRRTITMPTVVADALKAHQTRQLEERLKAGRYWQQTGLVFTSTVGTPMEAREVTRVLHDVLSQAGLPRVRMHDLRHTAATLLLAQGVNVRTIMEVLGHSQVSLTLNTYAHVMPALQADAAKKIDAALAVG